MKWLLVGLGNPGDQYQSTRHNVGFMVVDKFVGSLDSQIVRSPVKKFNALVTEVNGVLVMKPQTFMNCSGDAVAAAARFYKISPDHIIVVHDDLDIVQGTVKTGMEKGPKVHNGLTSVEQQLGTNLFWRVRVGIEGRTAEERRMWPGEKYVLLPLTVQDKLLINESVAIAAQKIERILQGKQS